MNTHTPTYIAIISLLFLLALPAQSQSRKATGKKLSATEQMLSAYSDSLASYRHRIDSLTHLADSLRSDRDYTSDNKYYKLFSPLNFYHNVSGNQLELSGDTLNSVDKTLLHIYMKRPDLVRMTDSRLAKKEKENTEEAIVIEHPQKVELAKQPMVEDVSMDNNKSDVNEPLQLYVAKPHFWTFNGDYFLQFLQNHVSDNWYKGGTDSYSLLGTVTLQYNYNNKQKVKWDNKLELRLGFQNSESDSINKFKSTEDLIRYTTKLGLQAHKNWYYTAQLIAYTQFTQGRKDNNRNVYSDFMSPFNLNLSLGMDYNYTSQNKRFTTTVHLAPLAFNFKYVGREALETSFGIKSGHHTLEDFGSTCTAEFTWQPADMVKWKSRLYAYTTYHKIEAEFENTITFTFSRFISANLFLYPRFDDSVSRKDDGTLLQFKEYLSFGFSYSM